MKKEVKQLRQKALESLVLSIELFNRPSNSGRTHAVLIFLDHAFEMLLKAAILHRGGCIYEPGEPHTIGFDPCIRKGVSDGAIKFLSESQVVSLRTLNLLRDAAQHHLVELSEQHLYIHSQSGLSVFREIFENVFETPLVTHLPERVLPISTVPPSELNALFSNEAAEIEKLLRPKSRRFKDVEAKIRGLVLVERALKGEEGQPSPSELRKIAISLATNSSAWNDVFPGVASISFSAEGYGPALNLRIVKDENALPIRIVKEDEDATAVAIKKVDESGWYTLGRDDVASAVGLNGPKTTAYIRFLEIQKKVECYKHVVIGASKFHRYSPKAVQLIKEAMIIHPAESVWKSHGIRGRKHR